MSDMEYDYWQLGDDDESIELMDLHVKEPVPVIRIPELLKKAGYEERK
jgi:hypothetical protein